MTHRASFVLSLCLALATPLGASAQPAPPASDPLADVTSDAPAASDAPEAPAEEAPLAPTEEEAAPAPAPAAQDTSPQVQPAPAAQPAPVTAAPSAEIQVKTQTDTALNASPTAASDDAAAKEARCAQLFAQGQTALAQAEGCAGGETPIYVGSQVAFGQAFAPAYRTLPNDNPFYALSLYLAPRFRLTDRWALFSDVTLGYEATQPDDTNKRNEVVATDTRIVVSGLLGKVGGVTFTTGPRIIVPTSKASWAARVVAGVGTSLGAIKNFDVMQGLALQLTGVYIHTFSLNLTRQIRRADPDTCTVSTSTELSLADCTAGVVRVGQDSFRIAPAINLNMTDEWSAGLSYVYAWGLAKKFKNNTTVIDGPGDSVTQVDNIDDNIIPDTRWRRNGSLSLSINYQPESWVIATLSGSTSVCYDSPYGGQSSLGGCAGGSKESDFWLRNPIANKFSQVSLTLTVPVDALVETLTKKGGDDKKTAKSKAAGKAKL